MKRTIKNLIVIAYALVAIFTTVCLLSYNKYKVSEFGDKTLVIVGTSDESIKYKKGDLVIVGREGYKNANVGDDIFFYEGQGIKIAKIERKNDYGQAGTTFIIDGNYQIIEDDIIGTSNNIKVISKVGAIISFLETKWGFLFLIVFPSLIAFLYQIYELLVEVSNSHRRD